MEEFKKLRTMKITKFQILEMLKIRKQVEYLKHKLKMDINELL